MDDATDGIERDGGANGVGAASAVKYWMSANLPRPSLFFHILSFLEGRGFTRRAINATEATHPYSVCKP